jgi:hypothetical protein
VGPRALHPSGAGACVPPAHERPSPRVPSCAVDTIREALDSVELREGLEVGVLAAGLALIATLTLSRYRIASVLAGGVFAAAAATVGQARSSLGLPSEVQAGLWLLLGAGLAGWTAGRLLDDRSTGAVVGAVAAVPGAALIATSSSLDDVAVWVRLLVVLVAVGAGPWVEWWERCDGDHVPGLVLLAISVIGVWSTVPDTERTLNLLGAIAPCAVVAWYPRLWRLGPAAPALMALVVWVAAQDGAGRPGSVVGAVGTLGVLLAGPAVATAVHATSEWRRPARVDTELAVLLTVHAVCAMWAARVAGLSESSTTALVLVAPALAASFAVLAVYQRSRVR